MKNILPLLVLLFLPLFSFAWGVDESLQSKEVPLLLQKVLKGEAVNVCVRLHGANPATETRDRNDIKVRLDWLFDEWFDNAEHYVAKAKNKFFFKDLRILKEKDPVKISFVKCETEKADIYFNAYYSSYDSQRRCKNANPTSKTSCHLRSGDVHHVNFYYHYISLRPEESSSELEPGERKLSAQLVAAIGNAYGLLTPGKSKNVTYSTKDPVKSIFTDSDELTCDDAEGLINAIDLIQAKAGNPSERFSRGWDSICKGRDYFYQSSVAVISIKDNMDMAKIKKTHDKDALEAQALAEDII